MPFTLSHAAAVLPGIRRNGTARGRLVASALVAGSFAPDVTYYAATAVPDAMPFGRITHCALGVVTVDVLTAYALVAMWLLVREPLVALLPRASWRSRVYAVVRGRSWQRPLAPSLVGLFSLSAVIGSATHVAWDAFTHADRFGTRVLPALGEKVAGFPFYWYAQYGGSALAMTGIGWFALTALRRAPAHRGQAPAGLAVRERRLVLSVLIGCTAAAAIYRCLRWYALYGDASVLGLIPSVYFGGGAGLTAAALAYAWAWTPDAAVLRVQFVDAHFFYGDLPVEYLVRRPPH
ncbi:DUF4184 family protein, partial [Streptomyces sp. NPDC051994]|uniref:DUF4184 family protein n=1 Tax=Streptomyces sp. NPDC051994 TaxID=3155287 RepID=UPI00341F9D20